MQRNAWPMPRRLVETGRDKPVPYSRLRPLPQVT